MSINGTRISVVHDELGPIYVYQNRTSRILSFDGIVEQSCMRIHEPNELIHKYTQAMMTGLIFTPNVHTVTIMGLGAGSMAKSLLHGIEDIRIHAIEYRQEVINTAKKYFFLPDDNRLQLHICDAVGYMRTSPQKSDIIFSDLYNSRGMEPRQLQMSYLKNCRKTLSNQGVLVLNLWHQDFQSEYEIEDLLSHEFNERVLSFPVEGGNTIVLAFKNSVPDINRNELLKRAKKIQEQMNTPIEKYAKLLWSQQLHKFGTL